MKNSIKIIFENNDLLVVDKPAGILVHPTLANEDNTLMDFLVEKYPGIEKLNLPDKNRVGIVHRLDKDTSGLIILAKNPETTLKLQEQFQERSVQKTYQALVLGNVKDDGKIEADITRGEAGLQKVLETTYSFSKKTRPAVTEYRPIEHYRYHNNDLTLLEVLPKTGRMHQIRVHLKYAGYPIIGDQLYNVKLSRDISKSLDINRQFLHAEKISFEDPKTGESLTFESDLPKDLDGVIKKLEKD